MKLARPQIPPKNPLAEKFWGRSPSWRAKRKGFGGNSAFPLRNQIEASPATCLNTWKAEHRRKILFSLKEEKIGRAQNEKSKEYFSVVWRACRAVAGLASLLGVLLKKSSNINQKTPQRQFNISNNNFEAIWPQNYFNELPTPLAGCSILWINFLCP